MVKSEEKIAPKAPVQVELYLMSKCAHGAKALNSIIRVKESLGNHFDLHIDYIGANLTNSDRPFASLHGQPEIEGNMVQLCAAEVAPNKHLAFLKCMSKEHERIPENWQTCAQSLGIDTSGLADCKDGKRGEKLLYESFKRGNRDETVASPTILINGEIYPGARSRLLLMRAICSVYKKGDLPLACTKVPDHSKLNVVAITDSRCKKCNLKSTLDRLKVSLPGISPTLLDWSDAKAKEIAKFADVDLLPVILFDKTLDDDPETAEDIADWLQEAKGSYRKLKIPALFDPKAEICDNGKDDTGNGHVDCKDPACTNTLACRPEKKGQIDLFIKTHASWGRQAIRAMDGILTDFDDEISVAVHYIAAEIDGALHSENGQEEIEESIRQLCIAKHFQKDYKNLKYMACRNENIKDPNWQRCVARAGLDIGAIDICRSGAEGERLLRDDIAMAKALGVDSGPTWLVNNKYMFKSISSADVRTHICKRNKLKGCEKKTDSHTHHHGHHH